MYQSQIVVSVCAKLRHAPMFLKLREDYPDVHFISRWIVTASQGSEEQKPVYEWMREAEIEIANSHCVIVYAERGEILKNALVQVGMAIAMRIPVYVIGENASYAEWQFWQPLVTRATNLPQCIKMIKTKFRGPSRQIGRGASNPIFGTKD